MPQAQRIAEYLLAIEAVKLSVDPPFTWTSGLHSPIYCDNRVMYSHPDARDFVVSALVSRIKALHVEPDVIAGTAMAAIGWAALVADRMKLPFVYVRAKAKEHGAKKRIEGQLKPGQDVVVVEDLISTGGSSMSTVSAIRDEGGCRVHDVVSIFTYDFAQALEQAQEARVALHSLASIGTLVNVAVNMDRISEADAKAVLEFVHNPQGWRAGR